MNSNATTLYDPIGNRLIATNNAEVLTYLANTLNQYTNIADGITNMPTYDLDGNMLTCGDWTYSWDGENRLISASNGSTVVDCSYDFMGRRYLKICGSVTNEFVYDGWAMIRELITDNGSPVTNSYVYGLDLSGSLQGAGTIGGLLWASFNGTNAFWAFDGNGNVSDLIGADGTVLAHYEYDPYGNTISKSGALADVNPFRFSTKYLDVESDLYYYALRYYSPGIGRWTSRDPVREYGGLNIYSFAGNASSYQIDILGLTKWEQNSCQGCNASQWYPSWGRWHTPQDTCMWNHFGKWERGATARFDHSCGLASKYENSLCDTETHMYVRVWDVCCKLFFVQCDFQYEVTIQALTSVSIDFKPTFLGRPLPPPAKFNYRLPSLRPPSPPVGPGLYYIMYFRIAATVTGTIPVPPGTNPLDVFQAQPLNYATDGRMASIF